MAKPTLVFCMSRKSAESTAKFVAKEVKKPTNYTRNCLDIINQISDQKLRQVVTSGIGYHHAGMSSADRQCVEQLFLSGQLSVLCSTSTLAVGVNLPAFLVVIKSTWHCTGPMGSTEELSDSDLLQMIGRAGRQQFDTQGRAVVMTRQSTKHRYESLLNGATMLESYLHRRLVEHLNAELVLGTVPTVSFALNWVKQTFLYVRLPKNAKFYQFNNRSISSNSEQGIDEFLTTLILGALEELEDMGLVIVCNKGDPNSKLKSTAYGRLMARHCIAVNTMKMIMELHKNFEDSILALIELVANCVELEDVALRWNERAILNALNKKCKFPSANGVKTKTAKISVLIQASLSCLPIEKAPLIQDALRIFRVATRVSNCILEVVWLKAESNLVSFSLLQCASIFAKIVRTQLWDDSPFVSKQLPHVGLTWSKLLAQNNLDSFEKIAQAHPNKINALCNRNEPFGLNIRDAASGVPIYDISLEQNEPLRGPTASITVKISISNDRQILRRALLGIQHKSVILIGTSNNELLAKFRVTDKELLDGDWKTKLEISQTNETRKGFHSRSVKVYVRIISLELVGCDKLNDIEPNFGARATVNNSESMATSLTTPFLDKTEFPSFKPVKLPAAADDETTSDPYERLKNFSSRLSKSKKWMMEEVQKSEQANGVVDDPFKIEFDLELPVPVSSDALYISSPIAISPASPVPVVKNKKQSTIDRFLVRKPQIAMNSPVPTVAPSDQNGHSRYFLDSPEQPNSDSVTQTTQKRISLKCREPSKKSIGLKKPNSDDNIEFQQKEAFAIRLQEHANDLHEGTFVKKANLPKPPEFASPPKRPKSNIQKEEQIESIDLLDSINVNLW